MKTMFLLQSAQDVASATATGPEENFKEVAIWQTVVDATSDLMGLIIMLVLAVMSVYAVYVFVERLLALQRASKNDPELLNKVKELFKEADDYAKADSYEKSKAKVNEAMKLCEARTDSPTARMLEKGISRMGRSYEIIATSIDNTGKLEISRLEQRLSFLATAAGAAPMIGFLGTTLGMVKTFNAMKNLDSLDLGTIAPGIMTAMVTTVAGLIVGIIAFMGYNYLVSKISKVVYRMENDAMKIIDIIKPNL